jgi:hypothetical protein
MGQPIKPAAAAMHSLNSPPRPPLQATHLGNAPPGGLPSCPAQSRLGVISRARLLGTLPSGRIVFAEDNQRSVDLSNLDASQGRQNRFDQDN